MQKCPWTERYLDVCKTYWPFLFLSAATVLLIAPFPRMCSTWAPTRVLGLRDTWKLTTSASKDKMVGGSKPSGETARTQTREAASTHGESQVEEFPSRPRPPCSRSQPRPLRPLSRPWRCRRRKSTPPSCQLKFRHPPPRQFNQMALGAAARRLHPRRFPPPPSTRSTQATTRPAGSVPPKEPGASTGPQRQRASLPSSLAPTTPTNLPSGSVCLSPAFGTHPGRI